jgi:hypothetical protein
MYYNEQLYSEPALTTLPATNIQQTSVTLNGNITNLGNPQATQRGFEYSNVSGFTDGTNVSVTGTVGEGNYTANLINLTAGTTYYYKAYVV